MNLDRLGKLLIEIGELNRNARVMIFAELAREFGLVVDHEVVHAESPAEAGFDATASMNRRPYSEGNKAVFDDAANQWNFQTDEQKQATVKTLARRFGRTEKAIRLQIQERAK